MAIRKQPLGCTVNAAGVGRIDFTSRGTRPWIVAQVSNRLAGAPVGATCALLLNDVFVTALIATGDVAADWPPVPVESTDVLSVVWSGCTPGQNGTALFIYDDGN